MADHEKRILRVLDHIHDHPDEELSLDRLAEVAALSRFHWSRVFKGVMGRSVTDVVRAVRMHRAAVWLVQTDRPIARIAADVGYPNVPSFIRTFGQAYGMSPARFRERRDLRAPFPKPEPGEYPMFPVDIRNEPPRALAALPYRGPYPEIGRAFGSLGPILAARDLWPHVRGMIGVYYDDPSVTAAQDLRAHAGAILDGAATPEGLEPVSLPGGRTAVLRYKGPYAGLQAAYDHLYGTWLQETGEVPGDAPVYEIYLNSPTETAPDDLLTEVCVPLAPAA
ncbi:MAG: AraC family transcriptional regulator [Rubricella sp.]